MNAPMRVFVYIGVYQCISGIYVAPQRTFQKH